MLNLDAATTAFTDPEAPGDGVSVGSILLRVAKPVHSIDRTLTARGIANTSAFAVVEAQAEQ